MFHHFVGHFDASVSQFEPRRLQFFPLPRRLMVERLAIRVSLFMIRVWVILSHRLLFGSTELSGPAKRNPHFLLFPLLFGRNQ